MPDLKTRHTAEGLNRVIAAVRRHNSPELWITDLENLNRIYREAKAALIQLEEFHLELLEEAIKEAEPPTGTFESPGPWDDGPCGYYPGSLSDPHD